MLPLKLTLDRFFSHRYSEIDFEQFNSVLLIGNTEGDYDKSNGCGKSAINESILWCLFGKARVDKSNDVVLWGEDDCSVTFEFSHSGKTYKIRRSRNRRSSTANVEFWTKDSSNEWEELTGSTSGLTDQKIIDVIKINEKTFTNSVYFRQNDISEFAEAVPSKRKEILKNIVDISRWDDYEKKAKEEAKAFSVKCATLNSTIDSFGNLDSTLQSSKEKISTLQESTEQKEIERTELEQELEKLSAQYFEIKSTLDTGAFEATSLRIENLKKEGQEKKARYDKLEKEVTDNEQKIKQIDQKIAEQEEIISSLKIKIIEDVENLQEVVNNQEIYHTSNINTCSVQLSELEGSEIEEGSCPTCGQDISEDLCKKFNDQRTLKISELKKQIANSKVELESIKKKKREIKESIENSKKIDAATTSNEKLVIQKESLSSQVLIASEEKRELLSNLKVLKDKLETEKRNLENLKNKDFSELEAVIEKTKLAKNTLVKQIEDNKLQSGIETERVSNTEKQIEKRKELLAELELVQAKASTFEKMAKLLGKQGIQTILLDSLITDLEETSNQILSSICHEPFIISLETTKERVADATLTETLDIKIRKDGIFQHFKSLSGGEQFRISLALRIAMSEIATRHGGSSLEFLLLDEINSPLDRSGTESLFTNVIKSLENKYKIVVITHNEFLKEKFDHIIDVTKTNGESTAIYTCKA
jgi:exonuclease SbcC